MSLFSIGLLTRIAKNYHEKVNDNFPVSRNVQEEKTQRTGKETGHSCGALSPHWSLANVDKDLDVLVFLLCPFSVSFSLC